MCKYWAGRAAKRKETQVTFVKGQSGNPAGRQKGYLEKRTQFFYDYIEPKREQLLDLAMEKARQGDSLIIKFLIERFAPKHPLHVIEYQKLALECEKLRKENQLLEEAPALLELLKEDPLIKEKLRERMRHRSKFTQRETIEGQANAVAD